MARAQASDFLHSMRFHVTASDSGFLDQPPNQADGRGHAGFSMCSTPEATVEVMEYKEGTFVYTRKFPGNPTMADMTLSRGVARMDSTFWNWIQKVIEGQGEYRTDLQIKHYHRAQALNGPNITQINIENPARIYHVKEAFPARHKVAGDMDATAGEISIMELDIAYEHFTVEEIAA